MYPRGRPEGMRRVAFATKGVVPLFSSSTGVVTGQPDAVGRAGNPNLPRTRLYRAVSGLPRDRSVFGRPEVVKRDCSLETPALRDTHTKNGEAVRLFSKSFHFRDVSLRWMKKWRRPNPVRCRDCDLRFSFPRSSRNLPFLSHDARVEMGQSVTLN